MTDQITYSLPLSFYFETKLPVPIDELVRSLLALEKIAAKVPLFLGNLSGTAIDLHELKVEKIESGSLKEILELTLSFLSEEEKEKFVKWLNETKMGRATKIAAVGGLASIAVLLIASTAITAYDTFTKSDTPSIQANNNIIINVGADAIGVSQEHLATAVAASMSGDKKKVVKAALDFVRPASGENGGSIHAGESKVSAVAFSHEAARDAPAQPDFRVRDIDLKYENTVVQIRVLDRDKTSGGWKATLPSVAENKRLSLYFNDGLEPGKASTEAEIKADVIVTYAQDFNKGSMIPKSVIVTKIY